MSDDCDDNVLLDADDGSGVKSRRSKPSDFIPKPRLLTAPASKLAAFAQSQPQTLPDGGHTSSTAATVQDRGDIKFNDDISHDTAEGVTVIRNNKMSPGTPRGAAHGIRVNGTDGVEQSVSVQIYYFVYDGILSKPSEDLLAREVAAEILVPRIILPLP